MYVVLLLLSGIQTAFFCAVLRCYLWNVWRPIPAAARMLGLWVRITPGGTDVCVL